MSDLSTPDRREPADPPAAPVEGDRRRLPAPAVLALGAVAVAVALYATAGFLRDTGLYDVSRLWSGPADTPGLAALSGQPATPAPAAPAPFAAPPSCATSRRARRSSTCRNSPCATAKRTTT